MQAAKIEPGMRVLVREERSVRSDISDLIEFETRPLPFVPYRRRQRVGARSEAQQIHHHHFAVGVPSRFQEALLRYPSHGKRLTAMQDPGPIDSLVDLRRQSLDLFVVEIRAARERAAQE